MQISKNGFSLQLRSDGSFDIILGHLRFTQQAEGFVADEMSADCDSIRYRLTRADGLVLRARLRLLVDSAELTLDAEGNPESVDYPGATLTMPGDVSLLPIGGGFAFPVDDQEVQVFPEEAYTHSSEQSMGMIGLTRGDGWLVIAAVTPFDLMVRRARDSRGLLRPSLHWTPELKKWGYERVLRFFIGEAGGLTAACLRYRGFAKEQGFVVTLREKMKKLPQLERLIGAADIWVWHDRYEEAMYSDSLEEIDIANDEARVAIAREMKDAGMERAIFGLFFTEDFHSSSRLRELGYLVTKYDNYSDLLPSDIAPLIPPNRIKICDYTERRMKNWPQDAIRQADGSFFNTWSLRGTDGIMYDQNRMCARQAKVAMKDEIPRYAAKYGCDTWFIDVVGTTLMECYDKTHPMSRRQCAQSKQDALRAIMDDGLVNGTEEGAEFTVPAICYAEGRMSPASYRNDDAGRRKARLLSPEEHSDKFDRFMLNPVYRAPLWELVYHDCTVSYWYWGDSSNSCMELLPLRDLYNSLYGTPPLYSFHTGEWPQIRERILKSQRRACRVARMVGLEAMVCFEYLTEDKLVQRTQFANGVQVTANFSGVPYRLENGSLLPPGEEDIIVRNAER